MKSFGVRYTEGSLSTERSNDYYVNVCQYCIWRTMTYFVNAKICLCDEMWQQEMKSPEWSGFFKTVQWFTWKYFHFKIWNNKSTYYFLLVYFYFSGTACWVFHPPVLKVCHIAATGKLCGSPWWHCISSSFHIPRMKVIKLRENTNEQSQKLIADINSYTVHQTVSG